jgi:hypothetical protein
MAFFGRRLEGVRRDVDAFSGTSAADFSSAGTLAASTGGEK